MAQIVADSYQISHIFDEKDQYINAAQADAKIVETNKSEVEQSLAIAESSRAVVDRAYEETMHARDEAIAQANSIESECDQVIAAARAEVEAKLEELKYHKVSLE